MIRKSFIPPPPIRELRDLTRYRRKLVESRSSERNRLQKLLETANIKLASVMSDVFGVSGMAMLRALVDGELTREAMARLARGQLRKKIPRIEQALDGTFEEHHRYLLRTQLERLEQLDSTISEVDARIGTKLEAYREEYTRLMQIPGVDRVVASVIIAELGVDMSVFESAQACASWAGVCPGNNESAGKRKRGRTRRGNPHLKTALVEAAQSASRKKGSYLQSKILISVYHMLAKGEDYRELGEAYLDQKNQQRVTDKLVKRLEGLGYHVELKERETVAATRPLKVTVVPGLDDTTPAGGAGHVAADDATTATHTDTSSDSLPDALDINAAATSHGGQPESRPCERTGHGTEQPDVPTPSTSTGPSPPPASDDRPRDRAVAQVDVAAGQASQRKRRRRGTTFTKTSHSGGSRDPRLPPAGTILTRTYKGVEHQVRVLEDSFEYEGATYWSISRVATVITGTSWNGYTFFRLSTQRRKENRSL